MPEMRELGQHLKWISNIDREYVSNYNMYVNTYMCVLDVSKMDVGKCFFDYLKNNLPNAS